MGKAWIAVFTLLAVIWGVSLWAGQTPLGLPPVPIPSDNPQSPEKIELGKPLFEDKRFSGDGTVSCATCHDPAKVFADGLVTAEGIKKLNGTRNSPTVANAAYYEIQFWDGRRPTRSSRNSWEKWWVCGISSIGAFRIHWKEPHCP